MPQFGLLLMLILLPLQVLSGATTPRESMPEIIQTIMLAAPNTHFVILAQSILFGGGAWRGLAAVPGAVRHRVCTFPVCLAALPRFPAIGKALKNKEIERDGDLI